MSEIHNRTGQLVYLDVYGGEADALPTASLVMPDGTETTLTVVQDAAPEGIDERYHTTLTMAHTKDDGPLTVTWEFSLDGIEVDKVNHFEVVTPYLTIGEVKKIYPEATNEEAIEVEAAVRHVINAHVGYDFGYFVGTKVVEGHGESALRLPSRLIELTGFSTLSSNLDVRSAIITSDGWYLKKSWSYETTPIESDSIYWGYTDVDNPSPGEPGYEKPNHGYIITAPGQGGVATSWRDDYPFNITGRWGYESVPQPVKEAARLLVNDYACQEIAYRDRYLESIKAADWRLQFSSRAWESTGNVRADQLLSEYVLLDWAAI